MPMAISNTSRRPAIRRPASRSARPTDNSAAIAGETHEYTDMYPGMARTAREEGFEEIAEWFETLAKAEKSHAGRFQKALDALTEQHRPADQGARRQLCALYSRRHQATTSMKAPKREGSLEAPTRHPIAWEDPDFSDGPRLDAEMHRVFDICHGCRRCFNLCDAFPRLFDLIDDSPSGELDTVDGTISGRSSTPARCATCAS